MGAAFWEASNQDKQLGVWEGNQKIVKTQSVRLNRAACRQYKIKLVVFIWEIEREFLGDQI